MSSNQFVFGQAQCGLCGRFIEKPKYKCSKCQAPICKVHRGKRSTGFMGTEYFCLPGCPQWGDQAPQQSTTQPHRQDSYQQSTNLFGGQGGAQPQQQSSPPAQYPAHGTVVNASPNPASPASAVNMDELFSGIQTRLDLQDRQPSTDSRPSVEVVPTQSASPSGGGGQPQNASYYVHGGSSPQGTYDNNAPPRRTSQPPTSGPASPIPSTPTRETPSSPSTPVVHVVYPTPPPVDAAGLREVSLSEKEVLVIRAKAPSENAGGSALTAFAEPSRVDHPKNANLLPYTDRLVQVVGERRGIVVGAIDGRFVWQQRGSRHASVMSSEYSKSLSILKGCRCKHCGAVVPTDEAAAHVETHRRGHQSATSVDSDEYGTCCGDTNLLKSLVKRKRLGEGAQGEVWQCSSSAATSEFVIKDIKCTDDADATRQYQKSVRLMALDHPHLIQYQCVQRHKAPQVTVVMNFYSEGDVTNLIRNAKEKLSEAYLGSLALQVAGALKFMHSRTPPIVHGDIKPENLLMFNQREQVLLMDLDTSKELVGVRREARITEGTTAWMAPEAINKGIESPASDIWSTGLVLFVLAVLPDFPMIDNELFNAEKWTREQDKFSLIIKDTIENRGYSGSLAKLIISMLSHEPSTRPTPQQLEERLTDIITAQLVC